MQKRIWLLALFALVLLGGSARADEGFYVIAGGGRAGKVLKTQVFTNSTTNTTLGTLYPAKLDSPQWTYTKLSATSYLVITYQDCLYCGNSSGLGYGVYQVRVNDLPSVAGYAGAVLLSSGPNGLDIKSTTGVWSGMPKGDLNLSIWHFQVSCDWCAQGAYGWTTTVTVMEIEQ